MTRSPQDIIADHCAALLELLPGNDLIACVLEFAKKELVTEKMLRDLCIARHHDEGVARKHVMALHALLDREDDDLPIAVAELRDEDQRPVYCAKNAAKLCMYAWLDVKGWETTGWVDALFYSAAEPVPGRERMSRDHWPVGLASLISEALAELDTSEPDVWGES